MLESIAVDSSSGIGALAPAGVAVCDLRVAPPSPPSQSRQQEFSWGRDCARRALERLGFGSPVIGRDADGCPTWPDGICGSITHCRGYVAAAAVRSGRLRSIGIDAEARRELHADVVRHFALPEEREWLHQADVASLWPVLLFSAKESVFKAWFASLRTWVDFHDVRVDFHPRTRRFTARVTGAAGCAEGMPTPRSVSGRYAFDTSQVYTFAAIFS